MTMLAASPALAEVIEEISVTALRRDVQQEQVTQALATIPGNDIVDHKLVTDALAAAPGVALQQTTPGQGAVIIRGQKGSAVLHLVDGMRLNNAIFRSAPTQYLALVPASAVAQAEVLRGTPTSLYGSDAIGGVVQLVSRVPQFDADDVQTTGAARLVVDTAEELRKFGAMLDVGNRDFAASVSVDRVETGKRRVGGGEKIPFSGYTSNAVRLYLGATPEDRASWSLDIHYLEQPETPRVDELVPGFGQSEPSSSEFLFKPNRRAFVHGRFRTPDALWNLDWSLDVAWQRIDDDRVTRGLNAPTRTVEANRSDLLGLSVSASRVTDSGSWVAGAEVYYDEVSSSRFAEDVATGSLTAASPRFPDGADVTQGSVYANANWAVGTHHSLSAGARLSSIETSLPATVIGGPSSVTNDDLSGDVGWLTDIGNGWQFVANLGYGFRAPNVFDLGTLGNRPGNRFNIPNPDLASEHVVHGDIGVRLRRGSVDVSVVAFAMRYRDRITSVLTGDTTPDGRDIVQSANVSRADLHGLEASGRVALGDAWELSGNLGYTRGTERVPGAGEQAADRIPPVNGTVRLRYEASATLDWTAWVDFAGRQDRLSARDIRDSRIDPSGTPGWVAVGTKLTWLMSPGWESTVALDNVLDERYRTHGSGIDAPGVNLSISVSRNWD